MVRLTKLQVMFLSAALAGTAFFISCNTEKTPGQLERGNQEQIANGEYLVRIGGCNDCHTQGYPEAGGDVPLDKWLTGSPLGWRGPWGTTYASNLRLLIPTLTEEQWIQLAQNTQWMPPMPWWALRDMKESDLSDMYYFIKSLGPAGEIMPSYVPPGKTPQGQYIEVPGAF